MVQSGAAAHINLSFLEAGLQLISALMQGHVISHDPARVYLRYQRHRSPRPE